MEDSNIKPQIKLAFISVLFTFSIKVSEIAFRKIQHTAEYNPIPILACS